MMQEQIAAARTALQEQIKKLSKRERMIVGSAAFILVALVVYQVYDSTSTLFADQNTRLEKVERDMENVSFVLNRYTRTQARREAIEKIYKEVEIKEGAMSHIENLVKDKAQIPAGQFTIVERPAKKYGGNYEQVGFAIKFNTTNLAALMDFLRELTHGQKPLVLAGMKLTKNRITQALELELDVSSMREGTREEAGSNGENSASDNTDSNI